MHMGAVGSQVPHIYLRKKCHKQIVHNEMLRTLRDTDPFWRFWMALYREKE